ncbi:ASCH domain-containing protein [Paenibacillus sp. JTLBN-2024]|jgi:uncharacterized protein YhfF|uniref:ASCH domain-containing protein n=1 Tax=Paenibacillus cookii TaxID=157839 RepID=A0ABQ4LSB9_9BACL|nr:ASCH domain-containing protein [Paenibacillus cookii]GIO66161.1 hypothetical protein J21TS3_09820 [Paenibacillus cookii]
MNEEAQAYWNEYWDKRGGEKPESVSAWPFGADPDQLARLVVDGIKTATCSALACYEAEGEPLPAVGDYSIILNAKDLPVAIIQTVEVNVMPMNEVPEDFAVAEGEGDRSYRYWREVHEQFFTKELNRLGLAFSDDIPLVCERFRLVDAKS